MIKNILKKIPAHLNGESIEREERCRLCGASSGKILAVTDYWDIRKTSLVQCENCGLAQLDPMLTEDDMSEGCLAYYIEESLRSAEKERKRNLLRNFRKGVLFGYSFKKLHYAPKEVLEFGPGSGYFLQGLKFIFPDIRITVVDINQEVLAFNKKQHNYDTFKTTPEEYIQEFDNRFDLIIARDIIEHVMDIAKVFANVRKYSRPNGLFHFITPNGHEDLWKHYLTYNYLHKHSELLINHVNYFDGNGLLNYLLEQQFAPVEYYTYKLKTTLRGRGWKVKPKLMAAVSQNRSAGFYINEKIAEVKNDTIDKEDILNKWYINSKRKYLIYWISWYQHANLIKIDPKLNVGHEIYGLFQIPAKSH